MTGRLLHAGPVHRLVEVAARGRAVAEPGQRDALLAAQLERHREPGGDEHHVGQHRDHPDAARVRSPKCTLPSRPPVMPPSRPMYWAKIRAGVTPRMICAARSRCRMQSRSCAAIAHVGAGRHGLLPEAVVERAGDLALPVEHHRALLDAAHHQHRAQQPDPVLDRQMLGYSAGCYVPAVPLPSPSGVTTFPRGATGIRRPAFAAGARAGSPPRCRAPGDYPARVDAGLRRVERLAARLRWRIARRLAVARVRRADGRRRGR